MINNIALNHKLEEYNKKYRNRNYRLLKITKKEVEDFDKKNPSKYKHYLLKDRKWWLIGDTYYEIPKAPRFTWFRNLNGAVQIGTCVLAAGVVASAIALPLVLLNQTAEPEISIDDADLVTWSNKHYDKEGNACVTIKGKDGNEIQSLELNIENYKCIEDTDFTYDTSSGELVVKKACITAHPGKINIKPIFKEEKSDEEKFYDVYKKASKNFQESKLVYDSNDITVYESGAKIEFDEIIYKEDPIGCRKAMYKKPQGAGSVSIAFAGGDYTYYDEDTKGIKQYINSFKEYGVTIKFNSDEKSGLSGFAFEYGGSLYSCQFNKFGYVLEDTMVNFKISYACEPHEGWETLTDLDAAKAFVTSTYASKTAATMQSIDVTYDGRESTGSGATTVNDNMKDFFGSDYTDNSLYYSGNRTSSSVGTYFGKMQSDYEPIITSDYLDGLVIGFTEEGLLYKKNGSKFYIKGTLNISVSTVKYKIELECYYNSNGQCVSHDYDYYYEDTGSLPYICAYRENCKFNY